MQAQTPTSAWLRVSILVASGIVLAAVIASVCINSMRPVRAPASDGPFIEMDEHSFKQAIQKDRLYDGIEPDFIAPAARAGHRAAEDTQPFLGPTSTNPQPER